MNREKYNLERDGSRNHLMSEDAVKKPSEEIKYTLRVAGVNHEDPAIRQRLVDWLTWCSVHYGQPDFVAVEWKKDIFERVKAKREEFRCLLEKEWPNISENLLKILVLSLG